MAVDDYWLGCFFRFRPNVHYRMSYDLTLAGSFFPYVVYCTCVRETREIFGTGACRY
jgi:hypothetical protein